MEAVSRNVWLGAGYLHAVVVLAPFFDKKEMESPETEEATQNSTA